MTVAAALPALTNDEVARYSRHLIMPEVGVEGQQKLKAARALCVGAGGLGSPVALYLAAAGVGTLGIVDFDEVDFSNLQRQIIHGTPDVGRSKLASAKGRLNALNPEVEVVTHELALSSGNALALFADYDFVVDGTDNFPTRYLVNDACVLSGKPNVYGSIFRFEGQASVFAAPGGPCYRCMFPEPPPPGLVPSCAEGGVLGILPGVVGTLQATEAVKLVLGAGEPLVGRFLLFDALKMRFRELTVRKDPDCPVCGEHPTVTELIDYEQFCGVPAVEAEPAPAAADPVAAGAATVEELKSRIDRSDAFLLLDVRETREFEICRIPGSVLIPLGDLPSRLSEIEGRDDIIVHCKSGVRSGKAVRLPARSRLRGGAQPGGRHPRLDRPDRSDPAEVLTPARPPIPRPRTLRAAAGEPRPLDGRSQAASAIGGAPVTRPARNVGRIRLPGPCLRSRVRRLASATRAVTAGPRGPPFRGPIRWRDPPAAGARGGAAGAFGSGVTSVIPCRIE